MKSKPFLTLFFLLISISLLAQELPVKDLNKTVKVLAKTLEKYTGFYQIKAMSLTIEISTEKGQLFAEIAGMGKIPLKAGSQTAFSAQDLGAQLEFLDVASKAQKIKLYQGGDALEGIRINAPKELDYQEVAVGSPLIDYSKIYQPFESDWELIINGRNVGSARIDLRHALYNGMTAYSGGSIIRYEAMDNKPFADRGYFSKTDYSPLQARNAISQEEEITTVFEKNAANQSTINIHSGKVISITKVQFNQPVFGAGIYKLLSMDLEKGFTVKFPVSGFNGLAWEKALVADRETLRIEGFDQSFDTWRIEYASGTIKWITMEAPYLVKWQMPTGMVWQLKSFR